MPNDQTLCGMWYSRVQRWREHPAFRVKKDGKYQPISFLEFYDAVRDTATGFHTSGLNSGDKIALLSENRPEWCYVDMACHCLGLINVPIYPTLPPGETADIIAHSDSRWVVVSSLRQFEKMVQIRNRLPNVERVIIMDGIGDQHDEYWLKDLEKIRNQGRQVENADQFLLQQIETRSPHDLASIIYTSGTTGFPKGVMLTQQNFISNVQGCLQCFDVDERDRCLSFLPLSHVFERTAGCYVMMDRGITIAYVESLETIVENMGEVKPTVMLAVPRFYEKLHARTLEAIDKSSMVKRLIFHWGIKIGRERCSRLRAGKSVSPSLQKKCSLADKLVFCKLKSKLGGHLRFFISGGAPLAAPIASFFEAAGITILEGYGTTETAPVISVNRMELNKVGTVGKPIPGVDVRITDDGEILVKGPNLMKGYYKMTAETLEALVDGWYHTGDIGCLDADGYLAITDRKKDIIVNAGGKNVAPQKIEGLLKLDPYIADLVVHGDKRKFLAAIVVPDFEHLEKLAMSRKIPFQNRTELVQNPEIKRFILDRIHRRSRNLASFEIVRDIVLLDKEFTAEGGEVTPSLKLRRKKIMVQYQNEVDALYPKDTLSS